MPPVQPAPVDTPDSDFEDLSCTNDDHTVVIADSDSEEENGCYEGYELLSQDPDNCRIDLDDEDESSFGYDDHAGDNQSIGIYNIPDLLLPAPVESARFDEGNRNDVPLDDDHIEQIKSVMRGVCLPEHSVPPWASAVPEERWKARLLAGLRQGRIPDPALTQ